MSKKLNFNKGGVIKDASFIYVEWMPEDIPSINSEIHQIIEYVDEEFFLDDMTIEDSLPFMTFKQAEKLFTELRDRFGSFTFSLISLANAERKHPSIEGEPKLQSFTIDDTYTNIMTPLMEEVLRDPQFKDFSYEELALYFTDNDSGVLKSYAESLGVSKAELPYFPLASEVQGAITHKAPAPAPSQVRPSQAQGGSQSSSFNKVFLGLAIFGLLLGLLGTALGFAAQSRIKKQNVQLLYLYNEYKSMKTLQSNQHKADVFARFFISTYYFGDKKALEPFLSKGDAKYTQPEQAELNSTLLESVSLNEDGSYKLSYVVSLTDSEGQTSVKKLSFDVKEKKNTTYGFLVSSEPISKAYTKD